MHHPSFCGETVDAKFFRPDPRGARCSMEATTAAAKVNGPSSKSGGRHSTAAEKMYYKTEATARALPSTLERALASVNAAAVAASDRPATDPSRAVDGLRKVFRRFDADRSGALTLDEITLALRALEPALSDAELQSLHAHFDPDASGHIEQGEFVRAFYNRRSFLRGAAAAATTTGAAGGGDGEVGHETGSPRKEGGVVRLPSRTGKLLVSPLDVARENGLKPKPFSPSTRLW